MEKNKVRVVYDRRKKSPVKGVGDVELCIYFGPRERKYIKIASVKPEDLYAFQTSDEVKKKIEQCNNVINEMEERNEPMTAEIFSSKFQLLDSAGFIPKTFADFVADMVDSEVMKAGTKKHKKVTLDAIIRFGRFRTFDDITVDNIRLFNDWLHKEGGRTDATVHNYHKHLMKWTRIAFERHYITDDPYKRLHFSRGRSKERNPLTEEELLKLRELPLNGHIERARDLFIFSAYTGLAYADVCAFDFDTMTEKLGDTYYIDGSRLKTGNKFFTPILAPAMEI
ncbi:MAG: phage integrase SAM-like domain-containing protein, partial [Bacteroidaceae bacterium]|nr:phage integrase SAM-like domain-containing protein [Bacteroidaceae bacterium]